MTATPEERRRLEDMTTEELLARIAELLGSLDLDAIRKGQR